MKTAMQEAIEILMNEPLTMCSQKSIAEWLEACFIKLEKQHIIDAYNQRTIDIGPKIDTTGENYFNQTYSQQ